jgi:hypothetical protein
MTDRFESDPAPEPNGPWIPDWDLLNFHFPDSPELVARLRYLVSEGLVQIADQDVHTEQDYSPLRVVFNHPDGTTAEQRRALQTEVLGVIAELWRRLGGTPEIDWHITKD